MRSKKTDKEAALAAKRHAARAAIEHIRHDCRLGVGTGSTTNEFIALLPDVRDRITAVASSSQATTDLLSDLGFEVSPLSQCGTLDLYVDGADETDDHRRLIKGGGAALTGEKILVASSRRFVCIVDEGKRVKLLGKFPLPVEVIPMARSAVARKLVEMRGQPQYREGV
ncbi:MAG: ribose 5-phosphate isomerase A, partial [Gammaproteobacteria bacterium]|nr:ribose 5-phosphate isomerase A [Gammaproteobacteria bacterium]